MKIQSIAPIDGRRWPVGRTALVSEEYGTELIDAGLAILHPTETDPGPTHPCPCQDSDEPCSECEDEVTETVDDSESEGEPDEGEE